MNVAAINRRARSRPARLVEGKRSRRVGCSLLLLTGDLVVLSACFLLANLLYWQDLGFKQGVSVLFATVPLYLVFAAAQSAFAVESVDYPWGGASRAIGAFLQAALAIFSITYFLQAGTGFSRAVFALGIVFVTGALPPVRLAVRHLALRVIEGGPYAVVVIRDDVAYEALDHEVVITPAELGFDPATSDPFQFHLLADAVGNADRVLVACSQERYLLWSGVLKCLAVSGEILTDEHDHLGLLGLRQHAGNLTMVVAAGPLHLGERAVKRAFDLVVAGAALIVLLPLLAVIAIAVKLDSRGPVLFHQQRIGRENRIFSVLKFRSMYTADCDPHATRLTARNDSRVTRVGNFIRRTSIDELPQLFNVLLGQMSIVGPRPHPLGARAADLLYWDVDPRYRHRHSIKPGLTGLAQIRGFRGNTEKVEDLTNRLQADLEYAANWSLLGDLRIIGRTVLVIIHPNAF